MLCITCLREIPDDSSFCCYCGTPLSKQKSEIENNKVTFVEQSKLDSQKVGLNWGMFINCDLGRYSRSTSCPDWAKPFQRESWKSRGLIIWDGTAPQVTRLRAEQAVKLLNEMRESNGWNETGITVGEPAYQIYLDNPSKTRRGSKEEKPSVPREGKWVLINTIDLAIAQSFELYRFLQDNEKLLLDMAEIDKKERDNCFSEIYRKILGDELWNALARLSQVNPEKALEIGMEAVNAALGGEKKTKKGD